MTMKVKRRQVAMKVMRKREREFVHVIAEKVKSSCYGMSSVLIVNVDVVARLRIMEDAGST